MIKRFSPVACLLLSAFLCWLALHNYMGPTESGQVSGEKIMIINIMYFSLLASILFVAGVVLTIFRGGGYLTHIAILVLKIPLLILALIGALFFSVTVSAKMPMLALPALGYVATVCLFFITKQHKLV